MIRALDIKAAPISEPLIEAAQIIGDGTSNSDHPTTFLRRNSKWHRHLQAQDAGDHKLWEVAVLSHMRDAFRAGDIWLPHSRRYSAAKAGLIALTKSLGKELADHNIAVNCVTPAAAKTRLFDQMSEEHIAYMLSKIPRGRFLDVREAAEMVAWMASAENSFTTGAVFDLSGGRATY